MNFTISSNFCSVFLSDKTIHVSACVGNELVLPWLLPGNWRILAINHRVGHVDKQVLIGSESDIKYNYTNFKITGELVRVNVTESDLNGTFQLTIVSQTESYPQVNLTVADGKCLV